PGVDSHFWLCWAPPRWPGPTSRPAPGRDPHRPNNRPRPNSLRLSRVRNLGRAASGLAWRSPESPRRGACAGSPPDSEPESSARSRDRISLVDHSRTRVHTGGWIVLEILILISLGRNIAAQARAKGRSGPAYVFLLLGFWFGGEILGAIAAAVISVAVTGEGEPDKLAMYVTSLVTAII